MFDQIIEAYGRSLQWVLRYQTTTLLVAAGTLVLTIILYIIVPKGFFPVQDTGIIQGFSQAPQSISFAAMSARQQQLAKVILQDPAVANLSSFIGVDGTNTTLNSGRMLINLKPLADRKINASDVIRRLQSKLENVEGITLYMQPVQDLTVEDRVSRTQYQYTLEDPDQNELNTWTAKFVQKLQGVAGASRCGDRPADLGIGGLACDRPRDRFAHGHYARNDRRNALRRLRAAGDFDSVHAAEPISRRAGDAAGISAGIQINCGISTCDRRTASTSSASSSASAALASSGANAGTTGPSANTTSTTSTLPAVSGINGAAVPLSAFTHFESTTAPLAVNHQGQFPVVTISFNLAPNASLGDATDAINKIKNNIGMPLSVQGAFQGTAASFQASLSSEPLLILAALVTVYIVLGVLYESYIHPITILSTLPSAGVGAILALLICHTELSIVALIGIILLIGIVKKNGIMMIDFALEAERKEGKNSTDAIYQACLLRFRPIMMTTMAALLGGLPLALGSGIGSELRKPLGIAMVGGLLVSQVLTLYTTPVIYIFFDNLAQRFSRAPAGHTSAEGLPAD